MRGHGFLLAAALAIGAGACSTTARLAVVESDLTFERPPPLVGPRTHAERVATDDPDVTLWVSFADVDGVHTVRVRWIDPLGRVALDSGALELNAAGGYREIAGLTATLPIRHAPAELLPGTWRTQVEVDGTRLVDLDFRIEDAG